MSLNIAPKQWIAGNWVTVSDIGTTGTAQIASEILIVPLPSVSIADLTIEVEFTQRLTAGVGNVSNLIKIIRANLFGNNYTIGGAAPQDFFSQPTVAGSTARLRKFSFRPLQIANASTSDADGIGQIRIQVIGIGLLENSTWASTGIRARCIYLPV